MVVIHKRKVNGVWQIEKKTDMDEKEKKEEKIESDDSTEIKETNNEV